MLKGIDPRVTPGLMDVLMRMGHGDEIAVVDANFPSETTAASTWAGEAIALSGLDAPEAISLILGLMPLDAFTPECFWRMEIDGRPDEFGEVHDDALRVAREHIPPSSSDGSISRQDFYGRARDCFAVVKTGELRPYGCFILRMGIIA